MSIAIVTDSTAYLNEEDYKLGNIYSVPLSCIFKDQAFREGIDITTEEFFEKVRSVSELPTSSQPTVGDFTGVYESLQDEYDAVISIHLSSKISGTFQNAYTVAQSIKGIDVHPFDSELTAAGQAFLVRAASQMASENKTVQEIMDHLDELKKVTELYFVVDNLTNLIKGGRLSKTAGGFATLLNIKPVLTLKDGEIVPYDKIRTKKKALKKIETLFEEAIEKADYPIKATIIHAYSEEEGKAFKKRLEEKHPTIPFNFSHVGPVIGVHAGEGAVGLSWTKNDTN